MLTALLLPFLPYGTSKERHNGDGVPGVGRPESEFDPWTLPSCGDVVNKRKLTVPSTPEGKSGPRRGVVQTSSVYHVGGWGRRGEGEESVVDGCSGSRTPVQLRTKEYRPHSLAHYLCRRSERLRESVLVVIRPG